MHYNHSIHDVSNYNNNINITQYEYENEFEDIIKSKFDKKWGRVLDVVTN